MSTIIPGRRVPSDEITWDTTGAKDRNARASKGDAQQDSTGFEGSFTDLGNTAINPSSTAKSGGSKGTPA